MKELILNLGFIVFGDEFEIIERGHITIDEQGVITEVGRGFIGGPNTINLYNDVAFPRLINSHVHMGDCCFPDYGTDLYIDDLVGEPHGLKYKLLERVDEDIFTRRVLSVLKLVEKMGVYAVIDFREGGIRGAQLAYIAKRSLQQQIVRVKYFVLGTPTEHSELATNEVKLFAEYVDGVAVTSPLYYDCSTLMRISNVARSLGFKLATHISETVDTHEAGDFEIALRCLKPDVIIHGTHLTREQLEVVKEHGIGLVLCPRANAWFGAGLPPLVEIYELGLRVGLGTDNCGWMKPDLWREAEFLIDLLRAKTAFNDWTWVAQALTINPAAFFGVEPPVIKEGARANFMILNGDLMSINASGNKLLTVLKWGGIDTVKAVVEGFGVKYV